MNTMLLYLQSQNMKKNHYLSQNWDILLIIFLSIQYLDCAYFQFFKFIAYVIFVIHEISNLFYTFILLNITLKIMYIYEIRTCSSFSGLKFCKINFQNYNNYVCMKPYENFCTSSSIRLIIIAPESWYTKTQCREK